MIDRRRRRDLLSLAALLALSALAVGIAASGVAAQSAGDGSADANGTFAVHQGEDCYAVEPLGDGTENVSEFYDYGVDTAYSSAGTQSLQRNQESILFLYEGSEGISLVMVHDQYTNAPDGGTATFEIAGLPEDHEWAVEDDDYGGRDDEFDHGETSSTISWFWAPNRTDGAAVRGLADLAEPVTIDPGFNEEAAAWGNWQYAGTEDDRVEAWRLYTDDSESETLDRNVSVRIEAGNCVESTDSLAADVPETVAVDESFTAAASAGNTSDSFETYRWDFGDGANATGASVEHAYDSPGNYTIELTAVTAENETETTTASIHVTADAGAEPADDPSQSGGPDINIDLQSGYNDQETTEPANPIERLVAGSESVRVNESIAFTLTTSDAVDDDGESVTFTVMRDVPNRDDGPVVNETEVDLPGDAGANVTISMVFDAPGEYDATVGDHEASFSVRQPMPDAANETDAANDTENDEPGGETANGTTGDAVTANGTATNDTTGDAGTDEAGSNATVAGTPGTAVVDADDLGPADDPSDAQGAAPTDTATPTDGGTTSSGVGPGFGPLAAVLAMLAGSALLARRRY